MLDLKNLRHKLDQVKEILKTRGFILDHHQFTALDKNRKTLQQKIELLQHQMHQQETVFEELKRNDPHEKHAIETQLEKNRAIKKELLQYTKAFDETRKTLEQFLLRIPNIPSESTPVGESFVDNVTLRTWGKPNAFSFPVKDHTQLTAKTHSMDFERAASMTSSRFVVLRGSIARLHRALIQWMLDIHTQENGYEEIAVPYIVNASSLQATGQLPNFSADLFQLTKPNNFYLIPTGEVPLTNLARHQLFEHSQLPKKYVAVTPCFRSEAGSYGQDVKGLIRQHQFEKVELVQFVTKTQATQALESLTQVAENLLQRLVLPYRVQALCTKDLGFAAKKTYDIEVWLPSQRCFREISSCSDMGDFQARRLKAKWRCLKKKQSDWLHTLNGSGLAVGRTLVAILENYQQPNGQIKVPDALRPYMGDVQWIDP